MQRMSIWLIVCLATGHALAQAPAAGTPYDKVITSDAKTSTGIFLVHRIQDRIYYEIPVAELDKDFLWVTRIAKTTLNAGYGAEVASYHVIRWERHEQRILLRSISYDVVADAKLPIARAVAAANNSAVVMAFTIETTGKNGAPVIEVSRLFDTEVPEFSVRANLRAKGFDSSRSFVESVKAFPTNIEVRRLRLTPRPRITIRRRRFYGMAARRCWCITPWSGFRKIP